MRTGFIIGAILATVWATWATLARGAECPIEQQVQTADLGYAIVEGSGVTIRHHGVDVQATTCNRETAGKLRARLAADLDHPDAITIGPRWRELPNGRLVPVQ